MDQLLYGYSKEKMIALTFVDVSDTAKNLERKHLSGPTAGRLLGDALVAVALLSANLGDMDEKISLQMQVSGPVGGFFVDSSKKGGLRGFTNQKILNEFDGDVNASSEEILGKSGSMTIILSNSKSILSQQLLPCSPPSIQFGVARYFNELQNKPTAIEISSISQNHNLHRATGILMTRLPEGSPEDFVPMLEKFNDKTILKALEQAVDIKKISNLIGLTDLELLETRPLSFQCSCSHEKVVYSVSCLPIDELKEMLEAKEEPEATCHFCNETYKVLTTELTQIIRKKTIDK